jgi:hypothetical protein
MDGQALREMMIPRSIFALMLCWLLLLGGAAVAGQFDDAVAAYDQGQFDKAFAIWLPLAQQGNAAAQFNVAALYEKGSGVAQDRAEAARWYQEAAKQGDLDAQMKIAMLYEEGVGVTKDTDAARKWYRAAISNPLATRDAMTAKEQARLRLAEMAGATQQVIAYDYGRYVIVRGANDACVIALQGAITTDTRLKFDDVVASSRKMGCSKPVLMLESPGGGLIDGISIGKEVRAQGMQTVSRYDCASACGLIFMGGVERVLVGARAHIGLHQAASGTEKARHCSSVADGNGMQEIRRYLAWVVPATAAEVMKVIMDTPCNTITWVNGERSIALGVATRVDAEGTDLFGPTAPKH